MDGVEGLPSTAAANLISSSMSIVSVSDTSSIDAEAWGTWFEKCSSMLDCGSGINTRLYATGFGALWNSAGFIVLVSGFHNMVSQRPRVQ